MAAGFSDVDQGRLKLLFDRIDTDKDGIINASDLKALAAEFGKALTDERAAELISKADPGKTGKVDFKHFVDALSNVMDKLKALVVAVALFKAIDTDNSGKIGKAELLQVVKESGADVPESKVDELIAKVDKSGSGQICFKDFVVALAEFIKSRA